MPSIPFVSNFFHNSAGAFGSCAATSRITSETIDEVINTLPKSIKSGEKLLKAISPACTEMK
jgi:hypothetical protein